MITGPILAHFHEKRETILEADSSEYATKGLLLQKDEKEWWKLVAYYSKKHDTAEINYPIYDKKLLAIINYIKAWEPEFKAVKSFKILTNHRNLRYFYTEKQLTKRQVRWLEYLSGFNFKLEWRPGSQGGRTDALSRREQDLPADGADERIRARFQRLFRKNQLPVKINAMQHIDAFGKTRI
jgi:hypothetical protein